MSEDTIKVFSIQEQYELAQHAYRDFSDVMDFTDLISYFEDVYQKYISDAPIVEENSIENIEFNEQKERLISSIATKVLEMEFEEVFNLYDSIINHLQIPPIDLSYDPYADTSVKREVIRLINYLDEEQLKEIEYNINNKKYYDGPGPNNPRR